MITKEELEYLQQVTNLKNQGQLVWQHYIVYLAKKYQLGPKDRVDDQGNIIKGV